MYAVIDVETTGGKYNKERIIEIAVLRFDGVHVLDKLVSLVKPDDMQVDPFVERLTGIRTKMLRQAPKFCEIAKRLFNITKDCIIVAHNVQFDYRMLRLEYSRLGFDYKRKTLCTIALSKQLFCEQKSYSLGKLSRNLGIVINNRHRAEGDTQATLKLFKILLEKDSGKNTIQRMILAHPKYSNHLKILEKLPDRVGIYYVYNRYNHLIYTGTHTNIKNAVSQHLTNSIDDISKIIQREVVDVSYELTGSELIAQLKHCQNITNLAPVLNAPFERREKMLTKFSYPAGDIAIVDYGRNSHEKSVILIRDNMLRGYGYVELNHQLKIEIIENIITPMESTKKVIDIIELYLRNRSVLKIHSL